MHFYCSQLPSWHVLYLTGILSVNISPPEAPENDEYNHFYYSAFFYLISPLKVQTPSQIVSSSFAACYSVFSPAWMFNYLLTMCNINGNPESSPCGDSAGVWPPHESISEHALHFKPHDSSSHTVIKNCSWSDDLLILHANDTCGTFHFLLFKVLFKQWPCINLKILEMIYAMSSFPFNLTGHLHTFFWSEQNVFYDFFSKRFRPLLFLFYLSHHCVFPAPNELGQGV